MVTARKLSFQQNKCGLRLSNKKEERQRIIWKEKRNTDSYIWLYRYPLPELFMCCYAQIYFEINLTNNF